MPKIVWDDSFSVNHEEIDSQHKQWIEIFNELHENTMNAQLADSARLSMEKIMDYTDYHFDYEEKLMMENGYPKLKQHTAIHNIFRERMHKYQDDLHEGHPVLNSQLLAEIRNWLLDHILEEDKQYSEYLK